MTRSTLKTRSSGFVSLQQEAFLNLWRTYERLRTFEDALFDRFDLTPQQYNSLRLLRASHPKTLPTLTLAERLVSLAPDITRLLDKLVDRRLITRERRGDDRRTVRIGITADGLALLAKIDEPLRACHQRQLGHLSPAKIRKLIELLRAVREHHEPANGVWR